MIKVPANFRTIALPTEHGAWGFLLEPLLLGLLLAPSWPGFSFALAIVGLFLIHQPLKITVKDRLKGIHTNRSRWAEAFTFLYFLIALLFSLPLLWNISGNFLLLIALMLLFMLIQAVYDFRNQSREALPELSGAVALGLSASLIVVLANWELWPALALWFLLMARTVPSILFVRALLRKQKSKATNFSVVYLSHELALLVIFALAYLGLLPYLSALAMLILLIRAVLTLQSKKPIPAKIIGFREIGFGLMVVVLTALGFWLGV